MLQTALETLRLDELAVWPTPSSAVPDRTKELTRIIRRALYDPNSNTPLCHALRLAVARTTSPRSATDSEDEALRVQQVARRLNALLAQRASVLTAPSPHRDTVRH